MANDFFDDDLKRNDAGRRESSSAPGGQSSRYSGDPGLSRISRQKEETLSQASVASHEIEQLRLRQELLEKERRELEELSRKQDEYEQGKKEIVEKLVRGVAQLEKEEIQATRMVELLSAMRTRFKDTIAELRTIDETSWTDQNFQMELNKATVVIEDARAVHKKAMAQIEAASWHRAPASGEDLDSEGSEAENGRNVRNFKYWFNVGLGVTAPAIIALVVLFLLYLMATGLIGGCSTPKP